MTDTLFSVDGVSPLLAMPGDEERWYVPILPGAFLYRPGDGDARGSLFWVDSSYHPRDDLDVLNTEIVDVRMALRTGSKIDVQRLGVETYDVKSDGQVVSVAAEGLWVVSHLIELLDSSAFIPQRPRESVDSYSRRCDGMRLTRYTFDWRAAPSGDCSRLSVACAAGGAPRPGRVGARGPPRLSGQLARA